jgi:hypothetical protein
VDEIEIRLEAGNTSSVWRRGATIRRSTGPWTPAVHGLLRHLEVADFQGAPRVLGLDEQGREVLTYLEGEVPVYPTAPELWSEAVLEEVAASGYPPRARALATRRTAEHPDPSPRHEDQ